MRTTTNPAFYADQLRLLLADEPERLQHLLTRHDSLDLLTWNVFASLDTHTDRDYLAYRLQAFGGGAVRAPARVSLWTGARREPLLRPSRGYVEQVRARAAAVGGDAASTAAFEAPVEVPVRIETPDVLILVETMWEQYPLGQAGRDRLVELVDVGLEQARRLSTSLAVAVVYPSGTQAASEVSSRMSQLRQPGALARELPLKGPPPQVTFREVPWQQLVRVWEQESPFLRLGGQPVRPFVERLRELGVG